MKQRRYSISLRAGVLAKLEAIAHTRGVPVSRVAEDLINEAIAPPSPPIDMFPPGAFCGICARDCRGLLYQEPFGRDGGLVNICEHCRGARYPRGVAL